MARTADQLLTQMMRFVPPQFEGAEELLSAYAGAMELAEAAAGTLQPLGTIGQGDGKWLTLQGHGLGVLRATNETDESMRIRLRQVEDKVTKPAIKSAVDALITPDECEIVEWYEGEYLDVDMWLDNPDTLLSGGPNSFIVKIPPQGGGFDFGGVLDVDLWLDTEFLGDGPEPAVYDAICSEVNRIRAAGTFWRLVLVEG